MSEYETEPFRGLPELPPEDEPVLWQGAPDGGSISRHALLGGGVAVYFATLAAVVITSAMMGGVALTETLNASTYFATAGLATLCLLRLVGRLVERSTVYTITSKRVVMRIGVALPLTLNIPFSKIASADVKLYRNGTGDIALKPACKLPLTYLHLWPHARGFAFLSPEPAFRCVGDAQSVARLLVEAMVAAGIEARVKPLAPTKSSFSATTGVPKPVSAAA